MNDSLDPRIFIELRKLESESYKKGFIAGVFWTAAVIAAISGMWVIS